MQEPTAFRKTPEQSSASLYENEERAESSVFSPLPERPLNPYLNEVPEATVPTEAVKSTAPYENETAKSAAEGSLTLSQSLYFNEHEERAESSIFSPLPERPLNPYLNEVSEETTPTEVVKPVATYENEERAESSIFSPLPEKPFSPYLNEIPEETAPRREAVKSATAYENERMSEGKQEVGPSLPVVVMPKPKVFGKLKEALEISGNQGKRYRIYPVLKEEQARLVEEQTGIILNRAEEKISGFLGGGAFGEFYVAELLGEGRFVGIKVITGRLKESVQEAKIQQSLTQTVDSRTSHLMPLYEAIQEKNEAQALTRLFYVMPLAALGNVSNLRAELNTLENAELKRLLGWHLAQGLLLGLWQMHQQNAYHLDVKLENLVVDLQGRVSLIDFGCAEKVFPDEEGKPRLTTGWNDFVERYIGNGDPNYFAPERPQANSGNNFDCRASDLYSAGVALWELWTGEKVKDYRNAHPGRALFDHPRLQAVPANSLGDLVIRLIQTRPADRGTLEQALNHPIFQAPEVHDTEAMQVVLDFLKRFVQQVNVAKQNPTVGLSLNHLAKSQSTENKEETLTPAFKKLQNPFAERLDIQEQLRLYLPLQGSLAKEVKEVDKDCFSLVEKTYDWLADPNQTLLVLLADGGSGKSLFTQHLTMDLLQKGADSNSKPWLPLYIALGSIKHPDNLLEEGLGLSQRDILKLQENYRLLLIADGYDEQSTWTNLYVQNQLHRYDLKLLITCRMNALPAVYSPYFVPQVHGVHYAQQMSGNVSVKEIFRYTKPSQQEIDETVEQLFEY